MRKKKKGKKTRAREDAGRRETPGGGSCAGAALRVRVRRVYNRADAVVP